MAEVAGWVHTVAGRVPAADLGVTYCHEHLLTDPAPWLTGPDRDLTLDDESRAAAELADFRAAGGATIVEMTTPEFGRDASGLARLAAATGIRIVATTGHVSEEYWRGVLDLESAVESELEAAYVGDLTDGIDGSGVRAGVVKAGTSLDEVTPTEEKLLRAAARAQTLTGAPILTHTTAGTVALDQLEILDRAGADLSHVCIGHLDRRLDWDTHRAVAAAGAFLGYDCISKEQYESDADRATFIVRLIDEGFGDRVCLSGDLARRRYLRAWGGGPGYRHILGPFADRLAGAGLDEAARRVLLVDNPARLLAWRSPAAP
jgi:predicted metal-dependent phosphotriesterase family hydrolase